MLTLKLLTLDEQAISLLSGNKELNCRFYREIQCFEKFPRKVPDISKLQYVKLNLLEL